MPLTPSQLSQMNRAKALRRWSREDPKAGTQAARDKFTARFEREVDPEGVLPEDERARRAERARKAYFAELSCKSSRARSGRGA